MDKETLVVCLKNLRSEIDNIIGECEKDQTHDHSVLFQIIEESEGITQSQLIKQLRENKKWGWGVNKTREILNGFVKEEKMVLREKDALGSYHYYLVKDKPLSEEVKEKEEKLKKGSPLDTWDEGKWDELVNKEKKGVGNG